MVKFFAEHATLPRATTEMSDRQKLNFPLVQDEDGYPPFASEGLWVEDLGERRFKVDNIPFFAPDLSADDVVEAEVSPEGLLTYVRTIQPSSNSTIRVVIYEESAKEAFFNELQRFGCDYEGAASINLVAINVPETADVGQLLAFLKGQSDSEQIDYEESAPRYLASRTLLGET
jgi:hypothetical protein